MARARAGHVAVPLLDGTVLMVGGADFPVTCQPGGTMVSPRADHVATMLGNGKVLLEGGRNPTTNTAELYDPSTGQFSALPNMATYHGNTRHDVLLPNGKVLIAGPATRAELFDPGANTFTEVGNMTAPRWAYGAALLQSGNVLIVGGDGNPPLASAELFDPATGTFTATGSMSIGRSTPFCVALADGRVLVGGGDNQNGIEASAEIYDPSTGDFTPTGNMTNPRNAAGAMLLLDGKVLVFGGSDSNGALLTAEIYDPVAGTFTPTTGAMTAAHGSQTTSVRLADGRVLIAAVYAQTLASIEIYDPATQTFAYVGNMATNRNQPTVTLLPNGKVLLTGGLGDANAPLQTAELFDPSVPYVQPAEELYDPSADTFADTGSMLQLRQKCAAVALADGTVLVIGGQSPGGPTANAEIYDPTAGTFTATGAMATPRQIQSVTNGRAPFTATLLPNGQVIVTGGTDITGYPVASAELYDPTSGTFSPAASMAVLRSNHTATPLSDGRLLIAGSVGTPDVRCEIYDPSTGSFTITGSMVQPRECHGANLLRDGTVLVEGGNTTSGILSPTDTAEIYDPTIGHWGAVP